MDVYLGAPVAPSARSRDRPHVSSRRDRRLHQGRRRSACRLRLSRRRSRRLSPVPECHADSRTQGLADGCRASSPTSRRPSMSCVHARTSSPIGSSSWAIAWAAGWRCWLRAARPAFAAPSSTTGEASCAHGERARRPSRRLRNIAVPSSDSSATTIRTLRRRMSIKIDAELSRHGIEHDFHRYPGVGHGFQNPARDTARERAAAEDAWTKTFAFLRRVAPA